MYRKLNAFFKKIYYEEFNGLISTAVNNYGNINKPKIIWDKVYKKSINLTKYTHIKGY